MTALIQRNSLCNEKNTKLSFFVPKILTDKQSELTWESLCEEL